MKFSYKESGCDPVKDRECLCVGNPGTAATALAEIGVDQSLLPTSGSPCIKGDFDKDGEPDYAFPGKGFSCNQSVPVRVIFTRGGQVREVGALPREVSCLQLYPPRRKPGPYGVPATKRQGLVDWGEGNATWVYLFDGKKWHATSYPSEEG
ncbi:hypothetical protein [Hyalangium rubrum]|uniref:Uncharacterized protein n=1 Tax=Hyalangium rubrum TaxID=3103134 RepID=A0ABU5H0H8_9BACT|nr:hypothetical protein [Hyalangium sp. s54d21]MDY7226287.1 hypothetical protein [Hyalangium sp. s54d21]